MNARYAIVSFLAEVSLLFDSKVQNTNFGCCEWCVGCADDIADDIRTACG